jgi:hypothetical protein
MDVVSRVGTKFLEGTDLEMWPDLDLDPPQECMC